MPVLMPYDSIGSTKYVDFDTIRPTWPTDAAKCHVSHVVADTGAWEQKTAQALEDTALLPHVLRYVKNHNVGFSIPYSLNGQNHNYWPDFIVCLDDGRGKDDPLNLILEVTGESKKDKEAKTATAANLWVPAVNNHGGLGRWAFLEIRDPWNVGNTVKKYLEDGRHA
jgi:type III restriction enzyme